MWHLKPEDLARLVDERPDADEAAHIADCRECAAELDVLREQTTQLAALPAMLPPPTSWDAMRRRLEAEGALPASAARAGIVGKPAGRSSAHTAPSTTAWMRAAAGVALFLAGGLLGAGVAAGPAAPDFDGTAAETPVGSEPDVTAAGTPPAAGLQVAAAPDARTGDASESPPAGSRATESASRAAAGEEPASLAARPSSPTPAEGRAPVLAGDAVPGVAGPPANGRLIASAPRVAEVNTPEEALRLVEARETAYLEAMTRLAELSGPETRGDVALRLATLDGIVLTTGAALREAPADPVINGYHLAARAQRDAMLRQVSFAAASEPRF